MSDKVKTYAVRITAYVDSPNDLEAVRKSIALSDELHKLTTHRATTSKIVEVVPASPNRPVCIAENLHELIARNEI